MYRYLILTILLMKGGVATWAQSTNRLYAANESKTLANAEAAPHRPKATESPFYVKIYGFYGLLTPGSQFLYSNSPSQSGTANSFKTTKTGLGSGPRAGIGIGIIASDFINIGIDAELLFTNTLKTEFTYIGSNNSYVSTGTNTTTLEVASIIPNITFKALSRPTYYIYNRLGLVGGIILNYKTDENSMYTPNSTSAGTKATYTYNNNYTKNSLAIGYQAALGIQFRLSQHIRGFVEIVGYNQSFKPQELVTTGTTVQGTTVKTSTNITQFKDQGDYTNSSPYQNASVNVPMNSIGAGAGLTFRF